jgi:cytochrome b6-f complex iron-sulfur subunit
MTDTNPESIGPCAGCLSRRQFLTTSALAAATMAVAAACGNGQIGPTAATVPGSSSGGGTNSANVIVVSSFPGLATVNKLVQIDSYRVVKRTGAASFSAFSMVCTHQGCLTMLSNNAFYCPCHGAQFDSNGNVVRGPASRSLQQFATTYDATTDQLTIG